MLRAFAVGFEKVLKSCLLVVEALPGLIEIFLHSCQYEDPCYDFQ